MVLQIFDVEHGACALLTCDNGNRLMIDCGHNATTGWTPGKHLQRFNLNKLDMLMITNYDEDHVSGLRDLDARVSIDWLVRNPTVTGAGLLWLKSETGAGSNIKHLADRVASFGPSLNLRPEFPGVEWNVHYNSFPDFDDENNLSMAVSLNINGINFLFPGDLERKGWLRLLNQNGGFRRAVSATDVLVASHHGRDNGVCEEMFDVLHCHPAIVVISDDYHQYDTQQTTAYYKSKAKGINFHGETRYILTTRCDGEIWFDFTGKPYGRAGCFKPLY